MEWLLCMLMLYQTCHFNFISFQLMILFVQIHNTNVTESLVKNQTLLLKSSGLFDLGYQYINIDTGWILSRDPTNHSIISDASKYPSGMYNLGMIVANMSVY